jgi:hypothetical protein
MITLFSVAAPDIDAPADTQILSAAGSWTWSRGEIGQRRRGAVGAGRGERYSDQSPDGGARVRYGVVTSARVLRVTRVCYLAASGDRRRERAPGRT